jgi:hypothetical protein
MLDPPSARMAAGFAAAGDRLFVFAGAFPTTQLRQGPPGQPSQLSIVNYTCELNRKSIKVWFFIIIETVCCYLFPTTLCPFLVLRLSILLGESTRS